MICVYVCCPIKPEKREEFKKIALKLMELTRREPGCLSYEIGEAGSECVAWVERWKDEESLALHKSYDYYNEAEAAMDGFFNGQVMAWKVEPFTNIG